MPLPFLLGALAWSTKKQGDAVDDAAQAQQNSAQQGIESQQQALQQSLDIQQPYRDAGAGAMQGLQGLIDPAQRAQTLKDYYGSEEFGVMQAQDEEQQLRNAAVTGGVRGGGNVAGMSSIAPRLGQQYMQGLQGQYNNLAGYGAGASSQGAQGIQNFGYQQSQLQQQIGQADAQAGLTKSGMWSNFWSGLAGAEAGLASSAGGF